MKRRLLLMVPVVLAAAAVYAGPKSEASAGPAAYARLKTLVGDWEATTEMGKVHVNYELIAGGTSLVEHVSAANMPGMMTVYYLDGDRLLLTHYCMAGNQPRMEAKSFNPETGEVDFQFLDGTNLAANPGHMHNAKFTIPDKDHFTSAWQFYDGTQLKRTENFQYTRVK